MKKKMQWLSTVDRSHRHLQLEVVQPVSSFACICIIQQTSFPWGPKGFASWGIQSVFVWGVGKGNGQGQRLVLWGLWKNLSLFTHLTILFFPSGDSGPEPPEVRILPGSGDPDTKDGTPRMVSGRRVWEMGIRLRFSDQSNLGSNLDSKWLTHYTGFATAPFEPNFLG